MSRYLKSTPTKVQGLRVLGSKNLCFPVCFSAFSSVTFHNITLSEGRLRRRKSMKVLTKHLDVVENDSRAGFPNPIVGHTAVGA